MTPPRSAIAPQIIDQASEWFVSMREPSIRAEDHAAFAEWLRASPVHVAAYLEIARLWGDATHIDPQLEVESAHEHAANVIALRESGNVSPAQPMPVQTKRSWIMLAASVVLCLGVGTGFWSYRHAKPTYSAEAGEQRVLTLEDGSTVKLNSRSALKIFMTPQQRRIELLTGQALFDVAQDKARPFIVESGDLTIRAVGTQFDVNRKSSATVVTVVEGRIAVKRRGEPSARQVFASAGEQVKVAATGAINHTAQANTAAAVSWLQQELIFEGQPLSDVIEELNRYSRTPIVLQDPSLATLKVNAVFHTTSPDSFLRYMSRFDGVRVERSGGEIRLVRRE